MSASVIYIKIFFITITINDVPVDIADDEGSFQFSPETEFTPPFYVHITFATDAEIESPYFAQLLQY